MAKKISKWNAAVVVIISLVITALFLLVMDGTGILISRCKTLTFPGYSYSMITEMAATIFIILVLLILGYTNVLHERGEGFLRGFYIGGFMTGYCIYEVYAQFFLQRMSGAVPEPVPHILIFAVTMFLIGFNEEMVFRGIVLNLFLDKFGNSKKGILTSVILSGVIFGGVHLTNIFSGVNVGSAMIQALEAGLLGILLAAIYLRSGNIWITIIAHALTDFASLLPSGIFGNGDFVDSVNNLSALNFLAIPVFLIPIFVLLRKRKLEEMVQKRNGIVVVPGDKDFEENAVVSLILGIISIVMGCGGYGAAFGVVGLLGAYIAMKDSGKKNGILIAGLVTCIIGIVISIIVAVLMLVFMPQMGDMVQVLQNGL